jgi:hypothetical protein
MEIYFAVLVVFIIGGLASMWQAIRNAKTSTDAETGKWFMIGIIMAAISVGILLVLLP